MADVLGVIGGSRKVSGCITDLRRTEIAQSFDFSVHTLCGRKIVVQMVLQVRQQSQERRTRKRQEGYLAVGLVEFDPLVVERQQ